MARATKDSHLNLEDLCFRDGLGVDFFLLVMCLGKFKFLLKALRFYDINCIKEKKHLDTLAPIRNILEQFVEN